MADRQITIVLTASGEGTLSCDPLGEVPCLGSPDTPYPSDAVNGGGEGEEKFPELFSNELDANIELAILLGWEYGLFIHAGADNLKDNDGPTAGNIQVSPDHAEQLYRFVDGPTRISISRS